MSAGSTKLDAVVTVADAKWLRDRLRDAPEAKNQIAFADVILINKTDLVDARPSCARSRRASARINPYAKLHRTQRCAVPLAEVLGRNAFDLDAHPRHRAALPRDDETTTTIIITTITMITITIITATAITATTAIITTSTTA